MLLGSLYNGHHTVFPWRWEDSLGPGGPTIASTPKSISQWVCCVNFLPPIKCSWILFPGIENIFLSRKVICEKNLILLLLICKKKDNFLDYCDFASSYFHNLHNIVFYRNFIEIRVVLFMNTYLIFIEITSRTKMMQC